LGKSFLDSTSDITSHSSALYIRSAFKIFTLEGIYHGLIAVLLGVHGGGKYVIDYMSGLGHNKYVTAVT